MIGLIPAQQWFMLAWFIFWYLGCFEPQVMAKIDLQNCSKKAKSAKFNNKIQQQNLLHVVCFDAEIIQTMFSLQ